MNDYAFDVFVYLPQENDVYLVAFLFILRLRVENINYHILFNQLILQN